MRSVTVVVKDLRLLRINLNYLKRQKLNKCGKKVCGHNSKILTLITPGEQRAAPHPFQADKLVKDTKKRVYIENTAKIRSTPKWQEAMDQSLFVTGGEGGGFWERSHGFQGGLRGGGEISRR